MSDEENKIIEEITKFDEIKDWTIHREREATILKSAWDHCPEPFDDEVFSSYFTRVTKANFAESIPTLRRFAIRRVTRYDLVTRIKLEMIEKIARFVNQTPSRLLDNFTFLFLRQVITIKVISKTLVKKVEKNVMIQNQQPTLRLHQLP